MMLKIHSYLLLSTRGVKVLLALVALLFGIESNLSAQEIRHGAPSVWERSVVTVEISKKQYDYYQPWTRRTSRLTKQGLVISDHQILTTADQLNDRTLVRLQRGGRGRWWVGEVSWIDYPANLALVTTSETNFWRDLRPAELNGTMPPDGTLQILRWREGNLEARRAEFTQFAVREGQLSSVNHVVLEADSDIEGAGWSEPIIANSHVVGLLTSHDGRNCTALTASFIRSVLDAQKKGQYTGLGFFHFFWEPSQNPACLDRLKLTGDPRGAIVIQVPKRQDGIPEVLKPDDIILRIDGFDIDIEGDYDDPEYGHLMLENLSTRHKWAGEDVQMDIWREGKPMQVTYRLPKYEFTLTLVPFATYDQEPEYLIDGGLVFEPLTDSYLQSWGNDWKRRAPFRLVYYRDDPATKDKPGLVILSQILPDPYNIGYQENRWLVVDKVNGQPVHRLEDLKKALTSPRDGYNVIDFVQSDSLRRIVLAGGHPEQDATTRVLKRYGIDAAAHFNDSR